jgi:hypothetical protein
VARKGGLIMLCVTAEGRAVEAALKAERDGPTGAHARAAGRAEGGRDRDGAGHAGRPVMPGAEPVKPVEDEDEESAEKSLRHRLTGRFQPSSDASWPGVSSHNSAGPQGAPTVLSEVRTGQGGDHPETVFSRPGTATVQHIDSRSVNPFHVDFRPIQNIGGAS